MLIVCDAVTNPMGDGILFSIGGRGNLTVKGKGMSELAGNLRKFAERQLATLDLLPDYLKSVVEHWNDIFFSSIPMLPFVVWWYLGDPPMAIKVIVFLWVFVLAGYYAWRKEHAVAPLFRSWIPDMTITPTGRLFVGVQIFNLGPPTTIQTWQAGFERSDGGHNYLSDRMLVEDEDLTAPSNIRGKNLRHDYRLLATGEMREGWIAFDVGPQVDDQGARVMRSVTLMLTDTFEHTHEISTMPAWARKLEK